MAIGTNRIFDDIARLMTDAAGARMAAIGSGLGHPAIVRCMPNLPCQIHRGMTVWTATPEVGEEARETVLTAYNAFSPRRAEIAERLQVDPRSVRLNTENGLVLRSAPLAADLAQERDVMQPVEPVRVVRHDRAGPAGAQHRVRAGGRIPPA